MVSLGSRITGVHTPFKVDVTEDHVIVYVPSAGFDGAVLYWGASLLKSLMVYEHRSGLRVRADAIESAFANLKVDLQELKDSITTVGKFREEVRRAQEQVTKTFDSLVDLTLQAETKLRVVVDRLEQRLYDELQALPRSKDVLALPEPTPANEIDVWVTELEGAKDKRAGGYRAIVDFATSNGLAIVLQEGELVLGQGEKAVARTDSTKTRVDVHWHLLENPESISFDPRLEKYKEKDNCIVISGKDLAALTACLAARLKSS
jgi:hypothetical protein